MFRFLRFIILPFFILQSGILFSQGVNPEIAVQSATVNAGQNADITFKSNNAEFWNIWQFNGTITWDPNVCSYNGLTSSQLFQMNSTNFDTSLVSTGVLIWSWTHLISIGQSIPQGNEIFTLNFKAVGQSGSSSTIGFANIPQALYWNNFAGWSGTIDTVPGTFTIAGCPPTTASFSSTNNGLNYNFTNTSTSSPPQTWLWEFGDGNTSSVMNPSHTYANDSSYNVCLYVTDSCGSDTTCQMVYPCNLPISDFTSSGNGLQWDFTDNSIYGSNNSWLWDFGNGDSSQIQNPIYTYLIDSTYIVCLTISDDCGQETFCDTIIAYDNTGIALRDKERINLYPNPTKDLLNISIDKGLNKGFQVVITSLAGELILAKELTKNTQQSIDLSNVNSGIYFVKIFSKNYLKIEKIIKK